MTTPSNRPLSSKLYPELNSLAEEGLQQNNIKILKELAYELEFRKNQTASYY